MSITDAPKGRSNRIVISGFAGVGLIITAAASYFAFVQPALRIENPEGERLFEVSTHGAIGVGTGATAFGTAGDCLKSGGGSGRMMSFGNCGTGGGTGNFGSGNVITLMQAMDNATSTGALANTFRGIFLASSTGSLRTYLDGQYLRTSTGALKAYFDTLNNARFVNASGDTMTGKLLISAGDGLEVVGTASGRTIHAQDTLTSSGVLVVRGNATFDAGTLFVDAAGNEVGIGTLSPGSSITWGLNGSLLDISAVGKIGSAGAVFHAGSAGQEAGFGLASGGAFYMDVAGHSTPSSNFIAFRTEDSASQYSPTERFRIAADGTFTLAGLASCSALETNSSGVLSCGTDDTGGAASTFGTGNVLTIVATNPNGALLSSTGALKAAFFPQLLVSSTGSLKTFFDSQYLRTSTGSLDTIFLKNTEADTEAELETLLTDVTNVFTNNDGSLADDNLSNNTTADLSESGNLYFTDERAQDSAGATLTDTLSIDFTYNDAGAAISAAVLPAGVDHGSLGGLADDDHTQYHNDSRALTWLGTRSTSDLPEGSRLYYLSSRTDARYVNISGDTMTGALKTRGSLSGTTLNVDSGMTFGSFKSCTALETNSAGALVCGADDAGGASFDQAATDARYVLKQGDTMTGALKVRNSLSGSTLTVDGAANFGIFRSCTALETNSAGALVCGVDGVGVDTADDLSDNTTSDLAEGSNLYYLTSRADARFVNTSGDTMTGALKVRANLSGSTLNVDNLVNCDTVDTNAAGRAGCGTDDDVPESGDFAAAGDLEADGTITDGSLDKADLSVSTDFGEITTDGSSNLTIDGDVIGQSEVVGNSLDFAELQDSLDVDGATSITLGANNLRFVAAGAGELEVAGMLSGSTLKANRLLASSGALLVETGAVIDGPTFVVDAGNNRVGIGTTAPQQSLEVRATSPIWRLHDTTDNKQWDSGYDAGLDYWYLDEFGVGRHFIIRNGGNVNFAQSVSINNGAILWLAGNNDNNWGICRNCSSMTQAMVTGTAIEINAHDDSNGGFSIGKQGGNSYMEIRGSDQQVYFRGEVGVGTINADSRLQVSGGGGCFGSDANCNTDNNTEGVVYSSSTAMTLYDVAERYPTRDKTLTAATLLSLDLQNPVFVKKAVKGDKLIGIYSTAPSVDLGAFNGAQFPAEEQVPVALVGRVPLYVTTENGEINVGDEITISSAPGVGMKAGENDQSVGYALEPCKKNNPWWKPWKKSECSVQVFVRLSR